MVIVLDRKQALGVDRGSLLEDILDQALSRLTGDRYNLQTYDDFWIVSCGSAGHVVYCNATITKRSWGDWDITVDQDAGYLLDHGSAALSVFPS